MRRLYDLQAKLAVETDLKAALGEIVAAAADFTGTDRGCVQLVSDDGERLEMFVFRGYGPESPFIQHFLKEGSKPACDAARQDQRRTIIDDVATFPALLDTEDRRVALIDGVRATQSTPMISRKGELVGVLSTQFRQPHRPSEPELKLIDMLAWTAADFVDRHLTEAALKRATQTRFRKTLEIDTVPVVFFDLAGGITDANDAFLDLIGYTRAELEAGEVRYEALTPSDWVWRDEQTIAELKATGRTEPFEKEYLRRDGSRLWIYCTGKMLDEGTAVEFIIDLTERKQAEAALRESEERFRQFAETSTDALWIVDAATEQLEYLSPAYERIWGEPRDATMADMAHWTSRVHPDDRIKAAEGFQVLKSGRRLNLEYRIIRPDGRVRYIHDAGFPIIKDGKVFRLAGVAQDLTERRLAERALASTERRARALIEGIPQLVWRADPGGMWTWASPQWMTYTGQSEVQSRGLGWLDVVHPDDRDHVMAVWEGAADAGEFEVDFRLYHATEERYRWSQTRALPVRDEHGAITEWLGTSTDVDDLRGLQERQQVLVAELQHRVRNMLTVVRSVFGRTVETGRNAEELADHFKGRLDALARTQVIVTQSSSGLVDLETLIRDELLSVAASEGPLLTIEGPDVALPSKAAESIGLAVHELTTNAVKYGALRVAGATLSIRWTVDTDHNGLRHVDLIWSEQGVPAVPVKPAREGFGRELIEEALPYRLGAQTKLEFRGGGVRCAITLPLPDEGAFAAAM